MEKYDDFLAYIGKNTVVPQITDFSFLPETAAIIYSKIKDRYPIVLTRDMAKTRAWLRKQARGTQRTGVLVTKAAARFKPLAVDILEKGDENAVHWFLEDKNDIRSSNFLEDTANGG